MKYSYSEEAIGLVSGYLLNGPSVVVLWCLVLCVCVFGMRHVHSKVHLCKCVYMYVGVSMRDQANCYARYR